MTARSRRRSRSAGMLLTKAFGRQGAAIGGFEQVNERARPASDPPADDRALVLHDHRHLLLDHAGLRLLVRRATSRSSDDPSASTIGDIVAFTTLQSRLFFPLGQLLDVQVEIQGALRALRSHLRVPRHGPRDRRRAGRGQPSTAPRSVAASDSATSRSATRRPRCRCLRRRWTPTRKRSSQTFRRSRWPSRSASSTSISRPMRVS